MLMLLVVGWAQITAIDVAQSVSDRSPQEPAPPPLTIHLRADGLSILRNVDTAVEVKPVADAPDWAALRDRIATDRAAFPAEKVVVINTDDGVPYVQMMAALDLTREFGYSETMLAGGAPLTAAD